QVIAYIEFTEKTPLASTSNVSTYRQPVSGHFTINTATFSCFSRTFSPTNYSKSLLFIRHFSSNSFDRLQNLQLPIV
ncbi:hypothetical protein, partial [Tetragenococcus halophilus]|uniref:hypothetical protein n=1 Tax=Tetragenococcus halophilus TaxID=51669 RepID=UPI00295E6C54